jgi:1-deoxy-D-xylulose-5-phosphate synthase
VPDRFLDHGKRAEVLAECGLTAQDISRSIVETMASCADAGDTADAAAEAGTSGVQPARSESAT